MSAARDESVQTSLRELMKQEEERVAGERDRLEQLRAAKARIDREREETTREAAELRARREREEAAALDASQAAAIERARIEALAEADSRRRAQELTTIATPEPVAIKPARPKLWFSSGMLSGVVLAASIARAWWLGVGARQLDIQKDILRDTNALLDHERTRSNADRADDQGVIARRDATIADLQLANRRLQSALDARQKPKPNGLKSTPPTVSPPRPKCANAHDPLCADLDSR